MPLDTSVIGKKFGRLTVVKRNEEKKKWECKCDCGKTSYARGNFLKNGKIKSCGCLRDEVARERNITHGFTTGQSKGVKIPEYKAWAAIKQRCYNPKCDEYKNYGAKGVTMCDEWKQSFLSFITDIGRRPSKKYSVERLSVYGNYEPSNCKWATIKEQSRNRRNSIIISFEGETHDLATWCEIKGLNITKIYGRIRIGVPIEKLFHEGNLVGGVRKGHKFKKTQKI